MKSILKNRSPKVSPESAGAPAAPASADPKEKPAPKYTPRGGSKTRILIAVKDSRIDFPAMGADSAKALNDLMHEPEVQAQFGIGPLTQGFDPQHCKRIYQALGIVLQGVGKTVFRWPSEATEKLRYTDAEQEELAKPTANVLDEMAPKWLRENQALASLLLVFGAMTQNKLREAAAVAIDIKRRQSAAASAAGQDGGGEPIVTEAPHERIRIPIVATEESKANGAATHMPPPNFGTVGGLSPRM
jgi:hypothetical protein